MYNSTSISKPVNNRQYKSKASSDDSWNTVIGKKRKFSCISRSTAYSMEKEENIINLASTLMSTKSIALQSNGNKYMGVWKEGEPYDENTYIYVPIDNKYGDKLKFARN